MSCRLFLSALILLLSLSVALFPPDLEAQTGVEQSFETKRTAGVDVSWRVVGDQLEMILEAPTTGWIAIGFDPVNHMAGANIIIGYVEDGELFIADDFGTAGFAHDRDTNIGGTNDIIESHGSETDGSTTLRFTIPLDSGDEKDKPLTRGSRYQVLVAHGRDGDDSFTGYHANRGVFEMVLPLDGEIE